MGKYWPFVVRTNQYGNDVLPWVPPKFRDWSKMGPRSEKESEPGQQTSTETPKGNEPQRPPQGESTS